MFGPPKLFLDNSALVLEGCYKDTEWLNEDMKEHRQYARRNKFVVPVSH